MTKNGVVTVCDYTTADHTAVKIRVQRKTNHARFLVGRQGFDENGLPTADVTGVGDEAFSNELGTPGSATLTIVARKKSTEVLVVVGGPTATLDQAKIIVVAALKKA